MDQHKPEPGDLIQVNRSCYQHWAVYVGDDFVVHLALDSKGKYKAVVKKDKLEDVVGSSTWQVNNSLDDKYVPCPVEVIVREANAMVGRSVSYSVVGGNCEHFVTELRYGKAESKQVRKAGEITLFTYAVLAYGPFLGPALMIGAIYKWIKPKRKSMCKCNLE